MSKVIRLAGLALGAALLFTGCMEQPPAPPTTSTPPAGPQLVVSPPPSGLPDTGTTAVSVDGTGFLAGSGVQIQQCAYRPGQGYCIGVADVVVAPDGSLPTSNITLRYVLSASDPVATCDVGPTSDTTCDVRAVYSSGPSAGTVGATAPVSFLGHP